MPGDLRRPIVSLVASHLPRARSYEARRRAARRAGHIRLGVLVAVIVLVIVLVLVLTGSPPPAKHSGGHGAGTSTTSTTATRPATGAPAIEAALASWHLNAPLSRSVVLPGSAAGSLIVAGGLETGGASAQGVYEVSSSDGAATQVGNLQSPLHDAAGVVLSGDGYLFGGTSGVAVSTVQRLADLGSSQPTTAAATLLGSLPLARAGDAAVTIGKTAYVVGGDNGTSAEAGVLATSDGVHFSTVANLPVPVRFAAVAALGGRIYVFGGDASSGPHAGDPVATVQVVDPATHAATIVGSLPEPVAGSAAVTLGGVIYVAGGETASASGGTPAVLRTVWAWLAASETPVVAGKMDAAVAFAGVTVIGATAFVVGGESAPGVLVDDVQTLRANPHVMVTRASPPSG